MRRVISSIVVLAFGAVSGGALGYWWTNSTERAICERLEADCGDAAMNFDDCLEGRQRELMSWGPSRLSKVEGCLAKAPRDCLSSTACVVGDSP